MITINNKFEVGEEVYSIRAMPMENTCDICKGNGVINYEGKELRCPQCKGDKVIVNDTYKIWKVIPEKLKIGAIKASFNGTDCRVKYKASGLKRAEQNLFKTFEEAQKRCDELNFVVSESN